MNAPNLALPFPPIPPEFDDFVAGENRQVLSAIRTLTDVTAARTIHTMYVWGGEGCGKTHLLRVAAEAARQNGDGGFYVPAGESLPQPIPGLLAVDDIEKLNESGRLLLFDWHNKSTPNSPYRVLAAGNAPPTQLPLGSEIAARLNAGLVFRLRELQESEKREALSRYARRRGFDLPDTVTHLLLTRLPRDMSNLIAALADLDRFLLMRQKSLTLPLVRAWLQQKSPTLLDSSLTANTESFSIAMNYPYPQNADEHSDSQPHKAHSKIH